MLAFHSAKTAICHRDDTLLLFLLLFFFHFCYLPSHSEVYHYFSDSDCCMHVWTWTHHPEYDQNEDKAHVKQSLTEWEERNFITQGKHFYYCQVLSRTELNWTGVAQKQGNMTQDIPPGVGLQKRRRNKKAPHFLSPHLSESVVWKDRGSLYTLSGQVSPAARHRCATCARDGRARTCADAELQVWQRLQGEGRFSASSNSASHLVSQVRGWRKKKRLFTVT